MNWSAGFSFLAALRSREAAGFSDTESAGMGTAFGLDASFGPIEVLPEAVAGDAAPAVTPSWEARLVRRSGL